MQESQPLAKRLLVVLALDSEPQFCVQPAKATFEPSHLHKLKGHGLIERDGSRYAYRLRQKGIQVALLFLFFHKRLCGPLANSRFHRQPHPQHRPNSRLEPPITVPIPPSNVSLTLWQPLEF